MTFQLFGFDYIPVDRVYGLWIGEVKNWESGLNRNLFSVYYGDGDWFLDIFWLRIVGGCD